MPWQIRSLLWSARKVFRHFRPIRNHQLISFASVEECVSISCELCKILKRFVIGIEFGMVAAAIQGDVDGENHISHLIILTSLLHPSLLEFEALRRIVILYQSLRRSQKPRGREDEPRTYQLRT